MNITFEYAYIPLYTLLYYYIGNSSKTAKRQGSLDSMNNYRNTSFINNISPVKNGKDMSHTKLNTKEKNLRNMNNRCFSEPIKFHSNDSEDEALHADGLYNQLESKIKSHSELKENIGDQLFLLIFFCIYFWLVYLEIVFYPI